MSEGLSRSVYLSLAGHILVLALVFLRAVFIPEENLQIRNAIRVDVVDLPDKMTETPKLEPKAPPAATPPPAKEVAKPNPKMPEPKTEAPTVSLDKKKKKPADLTNKQQKALDKLRALEALSKIQNEVSKEHSNKKPGNLIKGNQVSEGNSLSGLARIEYDRYFDDLKNKVLSQWHIPQWLAEGQLKASVQVLIDDRGNVLKKVIRRSSGNEIFDAKAMEAIDASSPLPIPPERLRGVLSTSGITFNFPE